VVHHTDKIYLENKDAFEYFSKWVAYHLLCAGGEIADLDLECYSPKFIELVKNVCNVKNKYLLGKCYVVKKEYIPEDLKYAPEED
jgi:hypothetical protein